MKKLLLLICVLYNVFTAQAQVQGCDIAPVNLTAVASAHSASLAWSAPATAIWDIYVVDKGSPAPTAAILPTYNNVTSNPFVTDEVTNPLLADTDYDFYVRVNCGGSEAPSAWSAGGTFHTIITCPKPTGLSVSGITTTSAALNWTPASPTDNLWDILLLPVTITDVPFQLLPANPNLPGQKLYSGISNTGYYTVNDLNPATIYLYYIRTICIGNDKSVWAGPFVFNTTTCDPSNKCNYKFILTDTGKNGWQGGRMQVRQNGIVVATLGVTITGAGPNTVTVPLCPGIPFDLYWSIAGPNPSEMGLTVQNPFTDLLYTKLPGQGNPLDVLFSFKGNCTPPTCPKPTGVTVINSTATSADLSWTESGTATQWEVYNVPTGSAPPVNGNSVMGVKPYYITNSNPFTITDLTPSTSYTCYVRAICSGSDAGTWTILTPKTFITTPLNNECSTATPVPVNPSKTPSLKVSGNTLGATASLPATNPVCNGTTDDDVWFSFTATSPTHTITLDNIAGGTADLNHTLYSGIDCASLAQLYCSDPNVSVATHLIPGNEYKIRVYTNSSVASQTASFDISITTPAAITNDECATAIPVPVNTGMICKVSASGSLGGATASADFSNCPGTKEDDVWFSFVATATTHFFELKNVIGTTTDLNFGIFSGICGNQTQMFCSAPNSLKDSSSGFIIGQTYYVRVWSNSDLLQDVTFDLCIGKMLPPVKTSTNAYTTEELVKKVLINNPCITVSNVTAKTGTDYGSVNGIGTFVGSGSDFPLANGIVLSTGNAASVPGPNGSILSDGSPSWTGDTDLESIFSTTSYNASVLEFDFTSMNEFMSFNFLFASEEYGLYQCAYVDAFAFILTDLTTHTSTNLAVVPGTNIPVAVTTIRNNLYNPGCTSENASYFGQYYGTGVGALNPAGAPINYIGMTQLMTASSAIIAGRPYHIKLVVADRGDTKYDSAVFIQGGSFSSGPPECMDKINLVAFVDANGNGIKDSGEETFSHGSFVLQKNNTGAPTIISAPNGNYTLYGDNPINTYDFTIQVDPEYASYYSVSANYNDINIPAGSGTQTLYFPVTVTQDYKDVSVTIIPMGEPVPGGSYVNRIVYTNLGTLTASGTINFSKPAMATITNISQTNASLTADGFNYNFVNLGPNETRMIDVTMSVPVTVNIDDILTGTVALSATTSKSINSNITTDVFTSSQKVVSSYSATEITEAHTEKIPFNSFGADEYLTYTIRFQNTGTANATSVRIEDELNPKLDIQSIRMISGSHNYVMERVGNKVVWHLDYINLLGEAQSEALSKGYVTFNVKLLPGFAAGDIIPNNADIYFDANATVATNTFNTEFTGQLANPQFESNNIVMYPNPTTDVVQVRLQNSAETMDSIVIYDLLGKIVKSVNGIAANQTTISVGNLTQGIYLVEITTQNKLKTSKKLVIQ